MYDLVWLGFYGISTIVGYLMSNPLYTHIKYVWFLQDNYRYYNT